MQSAQLFGPARVFAVDRVDYRLTLAEEFGAEPVNLDEGDPAEQLRAQTGGHGPDVVLECVGHEAPFTQAIQSVRPGGTVSSVGVYVEPSMGFPAREAFFKDLTLKMGICNARNYMTPLMPLVQRGQAAARADHHAHHAAEGRAAGLRDLRPEAGPRDQGDAQALGGEQGLDDLGQARLVGGAGDARDHLALLVDHHGIGRALEAESVGDARAGVERGRVGRL